MKALQALGMTGAGSQAHLKLETRLILCCGHLWLKGRMISMFESTLHGHSGLLCVTHRITVFHCQYLLQNGSISVVLGLMGEA